MTKEKAMENENKYDATGALFIAISKKTENSPDYSGLLEFDMDVVNDLIEQKKEGVEQPKVNLVGWKKMSKNSQKPYLRIIANIEKNRLDNKEDVKKDPPKVSNDFDDPIPF